ncbi:ATPase, T2SS/T4P/T4SS family [Ferrimonas marina]|uniref:Type II/IV secretion system protein n=1 Tax=Ferrimonas marina TaxID=299255 RepID=A0A1M5TJL7_9GAMM|nr:ATPase, T2SS/T4P/T4SS family [Ferrimonas marina]SHH50889.1 Type II/IV secretion system protein [Ferrimonas marina]
MQDFLGQVGTLYLYENDLKRSYYYRKGASAVSAFDEAEIPVLSAGIEACREQKEDDFVVTMGESRFRGHRMPTSHGPLCILRIIGTSGQGLAEIGITGALKSILMHPRLNNGGLVVICGQPGEGKTTTATSMLVDRANLFGGQTITLEDPAEVDIDLETGPGRIVQRDLSGDRCFADAIRDSLRAYPAGTTTTMLIGEVRDPETALLALSSAADGRLIVLTMHAQCPIACIRRLLALASGAGNKDLARELLASGIRVLWHQSLKFKKDGTRELSVNALEDTSAVVGAIKLMAQSDSLEQLATEMRQQQHKRDVKAPLDYRKNALDRA